jgi:hypothetical protein
LACPSSRCAALPWCWNAAISSTATPPGADKVAAFLSLALEASSGTADQAAAALVPWICDDLLSNLFVKAYGRDFLDFVRHMQYQGVAPLQVTADHVEVYKRA